MLKDREARKAIKEMVSGRLLFDEPMSRHTSIGVGGPADLLAFPESIEELTGLISHLSKHNVPMVPVGNCTNLIVRDGGFRGAMISLKALQKVELKCGERDIVFIVAEAGVLLSQVVDLAVREALSGVEFCAGIPGSIGGSVKMNAGAYGKELKDIIKSVSVFNGGMEIEDVGVEKLLFKYRDLMTPESAIITGATLSLLRGEKREIKKKVSEILEIRKGKHPIEYRNAGSIFKNLSGYPAGRIIDELGMKGIRVGDAQVSEKHGNFIVNLGHATADDVISLIEIIRHRVMDKRGIYLDTEVKIVGVGDNV
ncbi:MAG: UDP-N-acetylmuramate dehydrogenase [Deltaproteobacteria bacterium]|nr:UDP-N-acetylmuramate dehydrogenase [Deltaproteobacteria bacterium]